jgi:hypothetical protein
VGVSLKNPAWLHRIASFILIVIVILAIYIASSYDICNYPGLPEATDKGFIFSSNWTEHLHSSECYAVFYQTAAFYEGRTWLSQGQPPDLSRDCVIIGDKYYAVEEPVTAALLVPFYAAGNLLFGENFLIRSVMIGMMFFTCISALLVRRISLSLNQSQMIATASAFIFAFATMAFSYSKLLYPQPVVAMLMLFAIVFLQNYKVNRKSLNLFLFVFFYALTVFSFNAFIITAPFFLYYLFKIGLPPLKRSVHVIVLGILPILVLFFAWNISTTGDAFTTPRQLVHASMTLDIFYSSTSEPIGTWLNLQGIVGSLFSPVGIFFVSPILLFSFLTFRAVKKETGNEAILFALIAIVFWLFMSWTNLGGNAQRDFWIGGWASIARFMYIPSTLLVIFASVAIQKIKASYNLIGAWLISAAVVVSFLANLSYSIRHDLMVAYIKDVQNNSLLIWPSPISPEVISIFLLLASSAFPAYLFIDKRGFMESKQMK